MPKISKPAFILLMLMGFHLFVGVQSVWAQTRYVRDWVIITLREGPSRQAEVIDTLRSGARVEVLEEAGDYLKVRTPEGQIGYASAQYLTSDTPKAQIIADLERERNRLREQLDELQEAQTTLTEQREEINRLSKELAALRARHEKLKSRSENVLEITGERDRLEKENQSLSQRVAMLEEEAGDVLYTGMIKWFLAGGGVLLFGWLMGKSSKKKRSRF